MGLVIDIELLRRDPEGLGAALRRRHLAVDVAELAALDRRRREARARAEDQRAAQKRSGKEIAGLKGEAKEAAIAAAALLAEGYRTALAEAEALDAAFEEVWRTLPNPPHPSAPDGAGEAGNVEVKRWGRIPEFSFPGRDHLDLGEALGIIDTARGAKVSGARFAYLRGPAALLEIALIHFAMERLGAAGFIPVITPVMVRAEALYGTGFFPGAREQVYAVGWSEDEDRPVQPDGLYLVGTAEVPLAAQHTDEILEGSALPLRYAGFSTCFRREAGTYGKDTRGIFRVHQFDKVEMFSFCPPERSWEEHEFLLSREEDLVQALGLPYRVVNVCTGRVPPASSRQRMRRRRAWKSVVLEHEVISRKAPWPGIQASMSYFLAAESPRSPVQTLTTRYGRPSPCTRSSSRESRKSCSSQERSGGQKENISTLSNWWTRKIPRVSLPAAPASRRKQDEYPT